jgi:hypothetical protein
MRKLTAVCIQLSSVMGSAVLGSAALVSTAHADSDDSSPSSTAPHWTTLITARVEETEYVPHLESSSFGQMTVGGLTLSERAPDQRYTLTATAYYGSGGLLYVDSQITHAPTNYQATRTDVPLRVDYRPRESNVTFIYGLRYANLDVHESSEGGAFTSHYTDRMELVEIGARIVGRLNPESRSEMYAQVTAGLGRGSYNEQTTTLMPIHYNGLGGAAEWAIGYSFTASSHFQVSARAHLFLFSTALNLTGGRPSNQYGERAGLTLGPEINITYKL